MSPFRWDVLLVGFVLALPVLALGLRGDLSTDEMMLRLPWCLGAGWGVVALLRAVTAPRVSAGPAKSPRSTGVGAAVHDAPDDEHSPIG